eukprot:TRINITY_DN11803_c0_g1_i2.p1 TRINITY_DN11803_c0_g1~~TRINITY_DN11803_c0_g1_i2.p1  ORF type:complete len:483 (+),score=61.02 TRINITY_DN11803_c0_g1_i2:86-1534(+)
MPAMPGYQLAATLLAVAPSTTLAAPLASGSLCLVAGSEGQEAFMATCDGSAPQNWIQHSAGGITTDGRLCLEHKTEPDSKGLFPVVMSSCNSGNNQQFSQSGESLTSGGKCLDWTYRAHDGHKHYAYLNTCNGAEHQKVTFSNLLMVFPNNWQGSNCYRIPGLVATSQGTLLAFAEARLSDCGDQGGHNLVVRRSSDGGASWQDPILITAGKHYKRYHDLSNPNPVELRLPDGRMAILFVFDTHNNPTPGMRGDTMQVWSYDDGLTWHDGTVLPGFDGCMPGPASLAQSSTGALYFACHGLSSAFLAWSMDLGKTWQRSADVKDINECTVAPLPNGSIAMNCRGGPCRAQLTWSADGKVLDHHCTGLPDPHCQGSMIYWQGALYLSNEASSSKRTHLTVRHSSDEGKTWSKGDVLEYGYSGYSQIVGIPGQTNVLGVVYENAGGIAWKTLKPTFEVDAYSSEPPFVSSMRQLATTESQWFVV